MPDKPTTLNRFPLFGLFAYPRERTGWPEESIPKKRLGPSRLQFGRISLTDCEGWPSSDFILTP